MQIPPPGRQVYNWKVRTFKRKILRNLNVINFFHQIGRFFNSKPGSSLTSAYKSFIGAYLQIKEKRHQQNTHTFFIWRSFESKVCERTKQWRKKNTIDSTPFVCAVLLLLGELENQGEKGRPHFPPRPAVWMCGPRATMWATLAAAAANS